MSLAAAVSAPATLAITATDAKAKKAGDNPKPPETRLVAIGDSDFASNGALGVSGNRDLFLNTINWLAQQENLIAIRPRDPEDRRDHPDGRPGAADLLPDGADRARPGAARGRPDLVAEAVGKAKGKR